VGQRQRRRFADRLLVAFVAIAAGAVLGTSTAAARPAAEPVVRLYDVRVVGTLRTTFPLPAKPLPLDVGWSETSTWTESYAGVRVTVSTADYLPEPMVDADAKGKGTIVGATTYRTSGPRSKACVAKTTRSEPAFLRLSGNPYSTSAPGATRFRLDISTGRRLGGRKPVRPAGCPYYENPRSVELERLQVASGGGQASGRVDTRATSYTLQLARTQQPGRLDFPLDRLDAGAGFVLVLKGKVRQPGTISEGTARITFVPRAS
jgi:hypothetical protein